MTDPTPATIAAAGRDDHAESITAALLDALCSPQLYDIALRNGELSIKPRPHMFPQATRDLQVAA
jgi:hypothetical protein